MVVNMIINAAILPAGEEVAKQLAKQVIVTLGATALAIGGKVAVHYGSKNIINTIEKNRKETEEVKKEKVEEPKEKKEMIKSLKEAFKRKEKVEVVKTDMKWTVGSDGHLELTEA